MCQQCPLRGAPASPLGSQDPLQWGRRSGWQALGAAQEEAQQGHLGAQEGAQMEDCQPTTRGVPATNPVPPQQPQQGSLFHQLAEGGPQCSLLLHLRLALWQTLLEPAQELMQQQPPSLGPLLQACWPGPAMVGVALSPRAGREEEREEADGQGRQSAWALRSLGYPNPRRASQARQGAALGLGCTTDSTSPDGTHDGCCDFNQKKAHLW